MLSLGALGWAVICELLRRTRDNHLMPEAHCYRLEEANRAAILNTRGPATRVVGRGCRLPADSSLDSQ